MKIEEKKNKNHKNHVAYKNCYAVHDEESNTIRIGNTLVERSWKLINGHLYSEAIINKQTGKRWATQNEKSRMLHIGKLNQSQYDMKMVEVTADMDQRIEKDDLEVGLMFYCDEYASHHLILRIHPCSPFITSRLFIHSKNLSRNDNQLVEQGVEGVEVTQHRERDALPSDAIDHFLISDKHLEVTPYQLFDKTDRYNTLVKAEKQLLYYKKKAPKEKLIGNMLLIDSYLDNESMFIVKEAPTHLCALNRDHEDFQVIPGQCISIIGSGVNMDSGDEEEWLPCYGVTVGAGNSNSLIEEYKKVHHKENSRYRDNLFIMSNTWGDRNQDKCVKESFILNEIKVAAELGIDVVQIDDGWQKGITANSALAKGGVWEGYHQADSHFWSVNKEKFPSGLDAVVNYGKEQGVELGLWFSPDSSLDFANWEKDAAILLDLYRKYQIRYFKLDGIKVRNKRCEKNLIDLLRLIETKSRGDIRLNLDITAEQRFGYVYEKQWGTLFVENRYTDWQSYFPHSTLRNVWQLSKVLPTQRLQMELLNNKRNVDLYGDDPLAPSTYSTDYLFAVTMVTNPLFWMELSSLCDADKELLKNCIATYKAVRQSFFKSLIKSVGEIPSGRSFTGFWIKVDDENGYFLLFKERRKEHNFAFHIEELANQCLELKTIMGVNPFLGCQDDYLIGPSGALNVVMSKERSYALVSYKVVKH